MSCGHVYFISDGLHIKIGWSCDTAQRIKQGQTWNSARLRIVARLAGPQSLESSIHRMLDGARLRDGPGREWFVAGPAIHLAREMDAEFFADVKPIPPPMCISTEDDYASSRAPFSPRKLRAKQTRAKSEFGRSAEALKKRPKRRSISNHRRRD